MINRLLQSRSSIHFLFAAVFVLSMVHLGCEADKTPPLRSNLADANSPMSKGTPDSGSGIALNKQDEIEEQAQEKDKIIGDASREFKRILGDWKKPDFAFFLSGRQHGYIEPCGCTGLENQKGGLLRRHTLIKTFEKNGWKLVKLDAGNQVRRFGIQPEIKFRTTAKTLADVIEYDAIGFGRDDLRLPSLELLSTMQNLEGVDDDLTAHPFVSCNVTLFADFSDESFEEDKMISTFKTLKVGDKKICLTAILGESDFDAIRNDDVALRTPDEGIRAVWPKMKATNSDVHVLIAHTTLDDTRRIAKAFPNFDLIVTAGGAGEPTLEPEVVKSGDHETQIVQVGTKGMYAGVVGFYSGTGELKYKRIELSAAYEDSEEIKKVFVNYQEQVRKQVFNKLKNNLAVHPSGASYVGSKACADCHQDAYDVWKDGFSELGDKVGPHTHATASLIEPNERNWVIRKFDPECLSCHVTGWNPQKYFPYKTGYLSEADKHLHANGCENCHGPGSLHVQAEENSENEKKYQEMVRISLKDAEQQCQECHDLDNSPDFHEKGAFEKYWKRIDHSGLKE